MNTEARAAVAAEFSWPVRVYYEDTDAAGVVYHAGYLRFFERARSEWMAALGFPVARLAAGCRTLFVVRRLRIDFRAPARLGDDLLATAMARRIGHASIELRQQVRRSAQVLVEADVGLACIDADSWRPRRFPADLTRILETHV